MLQQRSARFVLNRPWRRNCRDSVTDMLTTLNWQTLEKHRKQSRLTLLLKFTNSLIYVPSWYLPVLSPVTSTRANHPLIGWLQVQVMDYFFFHLLFKNALYSLVKGFRPHGQLVKRLCLPPDTPIIFIFKTTTYPCQNKLLQKLIFTQ